MTDSADLLRPLHSSWSLFMQWRLPGMPDEDLMEFRRAYYGGASAMWTLLQHIAELPAPDRAGAINALQAEITMHLATVGSVLEGKL